MVNRSSAGPPDFSQMSDKELWSWVLEEKQLWEGAFHQLLSNHRDQIEKYTEYNLYGRMRRSFGQVGIAELGHMGYVTWKDITDDLWKHLLGWQYPRDGHTDEERYLERWDETIGSFRVWLGYMRVRHVCSNIFGRAVTRINRRDDTTDEDGNNPKLDKEQEPDDAHGPESEPSGDWEDAIKLREAINKLDAKCQNVIRLYYFGGLTLQEIAGLYDVSHVTIINWRDSGLDKLEDILDSS